MACLVVVLVDVVVWIVRVAVEDRADEARTGADAAEIPVSGEGSVPSELHGSIFPDLGVWTHLPRWSTL